LPPSGLANAANYPFSTPVAQGRFPQQTFGGSPNPLLRPQHAADCSPFAPVASSTAVTTTVSAGTTGIGPLLAITFCLAGLSIQ